MAKCLQECLQEVHLEKYQTNFVRNGICTCENLSGLSINDFVKCGIVSIDDRLRLFKLIQFIKSMQAQGHNCNHAHGVNVKTHSDVAVKHSDVRKSSNQHVVSNVKQVIVEDARSRSPEESQRSKHAAIALSPSAAKTQTQGNSQSPVFKCRKVLTFNDSELQSSESEEDNPSLPKPVGIGGSSLVFKHPAERDTNSAVKHKPDVPKSILGTSKSDVSAASAKFTAVRVSQPNVMATANNRSVVGTNAPVPLVEVKANRVNTVPVDITYNKTPAPSEHSSNIAQPSATMVTKEFAIYSSPHKNASQEAAPSRKIANEAANAKRNETHAYFQAKETQPFVEKVFYNNQGYNYGIPSAVSGDLVAGSDANMNQDKIRVCVRKRPLNIRETKLQEVDIIDIPDSGSVIVHEAKVTVDLKNYIQQHIFQFDEVFDETCSNNDVYQSAVRPLVFYVFRGGMATCFGFGQTGAGKSHTLLGNRGVSGLFMLAAKDMFTFLGLDNSGQGLKLYVSFYEIYCGHVFDLLDRRRRVHIRENSKHRICVSGLSELHAGNIGELTEMVKRGLSLRSTGSTGVNQTSSRSHAVLQFEVKDSEGQTVGRLTFIDLAGSERASDAKDGDRQTRMEGAEINQSLLALKECIRSLDQESGHTPYRQSKLTHVLRDSFVGNSRTVMIANVSPSLSAFENTMNTLRYANRVKELRQSLTGTVSSRSPQENSKPKTPTTSSTTPRLTRKVSSLASNHSNAASSSREPTANSESMAGPSVFHTSKIMSSTPKKRVESSKEARAVPMDVSAIIQDSPVKGHAVGRIIKSQSSAARSTHDKQFASAADSKNVREAPQLELVTATALSRGESIQSGDMAACGHVNSEDNSAEVKVVQTSDDDDDNDSDEGLDEQNSASGEFKDVDRSAESRTKPKEIGYSSNEINKSNTPKSVTVQNAAEAGVGKAKADFNDDSRELNNKISADKNASFENFATDALDASMNTTVDGGMDDEVAAQHRAMMDRLNSLLMRATRAVEREQRSIPSSIRPSDGHAVSSKAAEVSPAVGQSSGSVIQSTHIVAEHIHAAAAARSVVSEENRLQVSNRSNELDLPSPCQREDAGEKKLNLSPRRPDADRQQALITAADEKSPTVKYKKRLPSIPVPADDLQENKSPGRSIALSSTGIPKQQNTNASELAVSDNNAATRLDVSTGERPSWSEVLSNSTMHSADMKDVSTGNTDGAISNEPLDLRLKHDESHDKAPIVDSGISSHVSLPQPQLPLITSDIVLPVFSRLDQGQQGRTDVGESHTYKSVVDEARHRGPIVHQVINSQSYTVTANNQSRSTNSSLLSDRSGDTLLTTNTSQNQQPVTQAPSSAFVSTGNVRTSNEAQGSHALPSQYSANQHKQSNTQASAISIASGTRANNSAAHLPVPHAGSAFRAVHAEKAVSHNLGYSGEAMARERVYPAAAAPAANSKPGTAATEPGVTMVTTATKAKKHSPLKIEKLATFNPIQPFPATSYRQSRITAPTVITKTVLVPAADDSYESGSSQVRNNGHNSLQEMPASVAAVNNGTADRVSDGIQRQLVAKKSMPGTGLVSQRNAHIVSSQQPISDEDDYNSEEPSEEHQAYEMTLLHNVQGLLMAEHEQSLEEMTAMSKEEMKLLLAVRNGNLEFPTYLDTLQELLSLKAECIISLLSQIGKFQDITSNRIGRATSHHH